VKGNSNGWAAYRRLAAAGIPTTAQETTRAESNREQRWEACRQMIATWATTPEATKAAGMQDTTEKVAHAAYLKLSLRDKAAVDAWLDLGNSYFDALINSGVLTKIRTNPDDRTGMSERGAREVFHDLSWQQKNVVGEWLAAGHDLPDAILNANALGTGELVTPRDARRDRLRIADRQEAAEHESAHAVAAQALGLDVQSAKIAEDGSGECVHVKGTRLERAIVKMAGELFIDRFRKDVFPYGAKGLESDHRALAAIGDVFILRSAMDHCMAILKQNRAIVLATANQIEKYGQVVAPWL
jgi:hypothetical protein